MKDLSEVIEKFQEEDEYFDYCEADHTDVNSDDVHRAIGVLRERIKNSKIKMKDQYFSLSEINTSKGIEFIDPLVYKAICWVEDEYHFTEGSTAKKISMRASNIASDITMLCASSPTPKHLGLTVHLLHMYGRRDLIEDMYSLGYGVSYTEMRQFLTSAAVHCASADSVLPSSAIIPPDLQNKPDENGLIVAAADNWDHNEHTVDGNRTTHAMTSILIASNKTNGETDQYPRIKREAS